MSIEDNNRPLVSIVIPSFNQGDFIKETIESVLSQTYRPIEVIVIDAASTDNTIGILQEYHDYENVTWISEPDRGHPDGVNKGFERANGEIIGWLNSDDVYFFRNSIEQIVNTFRENPDVDIVYGNGAIISSDSTILRLWLVPAYDKKREARRNLITQPAAFFRRNVTDTEKLNLGLPLGLDYEYWLRLGAKDYRFKHINSIIAGDRQYPGRASVSKRDELDTLIAKYRKEYALNGIDNWPVIHLMDRLSQAIHRLKGFLFIFHTITKRDFEKKLAFQGKIDSPWKLALRQLFRSITQVG